MMRGAYRAVSLLSLGPFFVITLLFWLHFKKTTCSQQHSWML